METFKVENGFEYQLVFSRFITRKGKRIYHPKGKWFVFWVKVGKSNQMAA